MIYLGTCIVIYLVQGRPGISEPLLRRLHVVQDNAEQAWSSPIWVGRNA